MAEEQPAADEKSCCFRDITLIKTTPLVMTVMGAMCSFSCYIVNSGHRPETPGFSIGKPDR